MSLIIAWYADWLHGMLVVVIDRMRMITWLHGVWFVEIYKALHGMLVVVLNVIFIHFYHSHPYPSPRPGKYCHLKKRRKIVLFHRSMLFIVYKMTILSVYILYTKIDWSEIEKSMGLKLIYNARYTLHISHFLVNTIYTHLVNLIYYHLLNYPYYTNYPITYSIQLYRYYNTCNYIVTILISTIYQ